MFTQILLFLQSTMPTPKPFGKFHSIVLTIAILFIVYFIIERAKDEKQLKYVLGIYGIIALALEVIKQIIWSANINIPTNTIDWDYQWYAAPFQLCTTPIYISLLCLFLNNGKVRNSLLSYLAFITIIGDFMTMVMPESCFVQTIEVNIHTMWLHCGGLLISIYLLINGWVTAKQENLKEALKIFLFMMSIALVLNVVVFKSGVLDGETFNMFYISPYFVSDLPVFNTIQERTPYLVFLATYCLAIGLGGYVVYSITQFVEFLLIIMKKQQKRKR